MERTWIIPAALFVAFQQLVSASLALRFGFYGRPPHLEYGLACLFALLILFAVWGSFVTWRAFETKPESPLRFAYGEFRKHDRAVAILLAGFTIAWLQLVSLTWMKALIPQTGPMWADPILADFDAMILGTDAWKLLTFLKPLEIPIDVLYGLWALLLKITLIVTLIAPASRGKSVALLAFFLTFGIFGVFGQYLLPSGGPIFWERLGFDGRFNDFDPPNGAEIASGYLWAKYLGQSPAFASGISAFPSMHVAMAGWMVLTAYLVRPKLKGLMWFYFGLVCVGSVYLGWHYVSDGIAGALGALIGWRLSAAIIDRQLIPLGLPEMAQSRATVFRRPTRPVRHADNDAGPSVLTVSQAQD